MINVTEMGSKQIFWDNFWDPKDDANLFIGKRRGLVYEPSAVTHVHK